MVNLELYKTFIIVADEKNITKASNILKMSSSIVIKQIKDLEKMLRIKLFKKTINGLLLTEIGNELYEKLKGPITEIINVDNQFSSLKNINIGSHNNLKNKIFGKCINKFSLEHSNVNLNFINEETDEMLEMLSNNELDIIFSRKVDNLNYSNINFLKLGYLNDIFISNKKSNLSKKLLRIEDLKNQIIFVPSTSSQTFARFTNLMDIQELNLKSSSYNIILESVNSISSIGFLTREYIDEKAFKNYNLTELKTELNLSPIEFGLYLNNNKFKELNDLIRIIKTHFFFKDF